MESYCKQFLIIAAVVLMTTGDDCIHESNEHIDECNAVLEGIYTKSFEDCIKENASILNIPEDDLENGPSSVHTFLIYPVSTYLFYKLESEKAKEDSLLTAFERQVIKVTQKYSERVIWDEQCCNFGITKSTPQASLAALKEYATLLDTESKKDIEELEIISFFPQLDPYFLKEESRGFPIRSLFSSLTIGFNNYILNSKLQKLSRKTNKESQSTLQPETSLSTLLEQTLESTTPTESIKQIRTTTEPTSISVTNSTKRTKPLTLATKSTKRTKPLTLVDLNKKFGKLHRKQTELLNLQNRTETLLEVAKKCETCSIFHNYILIATIIAVILYTSLIILTTSWWVHDNLHSKQKELDIHELQPRYNPSAPDCSIEDSQELIPLRQLPSPPKQVKKYRVQKLKKQVKSS